MAGSPRLPDPLRDHGHDLPSHDSGKSSVARQAFRPPPGLPPRRKGDAGEDLRNGRALRAHQWPRRCDGFGCCSSRQLSLQRYLHSWSNTGSFAAGACAGARTLRQLPASMTVYWRQLTASTTVYCYRTSDARRSASSLRSYSKSRGSLAQYLLLRSAHMLIATPVSQHQSGFLLCTYAVRANRTLALAFSIPCSCERGRVCLGRLRIDHVRRHPRAEEDNDLGQYRLRDLHGDLDRSGTCFG